ncbi:MAG: hypothetical protein K940chlam9_00992 [Chlamydiae bacterium]|nr:hypothetical protein [Chlamydiota bacterium]
MEGVFKYPAVILLLLMLGVCSEGASAQDLTTTYDQSLISDDGYYVQPGGVYVAPDGIFVLVNGELKQVNVLCSDARGVFVPYEEMSRQFVWCSVCQHWYDPDEPHVCR